MTRLNLSAIWILGLLCVGGFANVLTSAAPPFEPEPYHYPYSSAYGYQPFYVVPRKAAVIRNNAVGINYPPVATAIESNNSEPEYIVETQPVQIAPTRKAPIVRSRSGRYYLTNPINSNDSTTSTTSEIPPTLAPSLQSSESTQPPPTLQPIQTPQTTKKSQSTQHQQTQLSPPLPAWSDSTTNSTNNNSTIIVTENMPSQLDFLNARLAKMQLEKKNLDGTLNSIDKIKNDAFKVQTLVDLAEYVSRDKNYKTEAERLFELALAATDAFEKKQPVIINLHNSESSSSSTNSTNKTTTTIAKPNSSKSNSTKSRPILTNEPQISNENPILDLNSEPNAKPKSKPNLSSNTNAPPEDELSPTKDKILDDYLLDSPTIPSTKTDKNTTKPKTPILDLPNETPKNSIENDNSGLPTKTNITKEKNTITDLPADPETEKSLILQPTPKKERPPLSPLNSLPGIDNNSALDPNNDPAKNKKPSLLIEQRSSTGAKIKLKDPVIMTPDEFRTLNEKNNNNDKQDKSKDSPQDNSAEKKSENNINPPELKTPINTNETKSDNTTKPKKKTRQRELIQPVN
ncbi:MAG: hypothetical protein LBB88_09505 [Planctomycetaceae bacterium]|jgi:hypothetical protein|nr:hypothetical protein [Planctomycetaceae bacterium]